MIIWIILLIARAKGKFDNSFDSVGFRFLGLLEYMAEAVIIDVIIKNLIVGI